jgi:hypothetical protein
MPVDTIVNVPVIKPGKKANLIGCRFGKLTVIKYSGQKRYGPRNSACLWGCQCDCGKIAEATTGELNAGNRWHCGCSSYLTGPKSRNWSGFGGISGRMWFQIQKNARARKIELGISGEDAWQIYQRQDGKCALTGVPIELKSKNSTASLDRIDSGNGYTADNVWWVHKTVNRMKWTLSVKDLVKWSELIVNYYEHRGDTAKPSFGN